MRFLTHPDKNLPAQLESLTDETWATLDGITQPTGRSPPKRHAQACRGIRLYPQHTFEALDAHSLRNCCSSAVRQAALSALKRSTVACGQQGGLLASDFPQPRNECVLWAQEQCDLGTPQAAPPPLVWFWMVVVWDPSPHQRNPP